ncbi:D-lactate dehydrogenase [cytochrome], mitochondrial [Lachnellula hyalina]|uniref:D-lactate dehydrogenase (cytochrome) n=1 Tax=Lachnellula hyalina TaxID=1316788 RepID=A0A8H8QY32_9HELO|nr:D-lactate dehydrogenase [cytochrome], mitochondrial [Lachnellula hyalina]TVY24156.1 D-lactate dehydrogenase [cytochrome], mitochondrial [Lachnellula hyalina]
MSLTCRAPSRALLASQGRSTVQTSCLRIASVRQRRCESTEQKKPPQDGKSFRGQLYNSTAMRLQREKADRERFTQARNESSGGRNSALSFVVIATALGAYYAGTLSTPAPSTASTLPLASTVPPKYNISGSNMEAAWADFVEIVGKENVSTLETDITHHAGSEWSTHIHKESERSFLVIYPSSTEEVSAVMKICHKRLIPVTGYSGGTSLEGQFAPTRGGICIDFGKMGKILKLHKEDMDVVVQPAVGWQVLNEELEKDNLFFPPDPGPGAMIGGMVGTGCSGTNAYRYGTMREWVLSLTVVLADGTIIKTRQRPRKSSAGYDLTKMFIGSEGTLGLVTEATLKLTTKPNSTSVAVCSFGTVKQAANCVAKVVGEGVPIAAIEILDEVQMKCINAAGETDRSWNEAPTLFFKFAGTPSAVKEQIGIVKQLAKSTGSKTFEFAKNEAEQTELWSARKLALWSVIAMKEDETDHVWTGDVAVPISRLPDIIEETKEDINKSGLFTAIVGHVGDGNFHTILLYKDSQRKQAEEVVHRMVKRAVKMEGTVTGEHGVGLVKRDYLNHELGETTVDAMRKLKLAFDPLCLLNPDKIVRVQKPEPGEVAQW